MITDIIKYVDSSHLYHLSFVNRDSKRHTRELIMRMEVEKYMLYFNIIMDGQCIGMQSDCTLYNENISDDQIIESLDSFICPDMEVPYNRPRVFIAIWKRYGDIFADDDQLLTYYAYTGVAELSDAMIYKYYSTCAIAAAMIFIKFGRKLIHQVDVPSSMEHLVSGIAGCPERWAALVRRIPGFIDWYLANLADDWRCHCKAEITFAEFAFTSFAASQQIPRDPNDAFKLCSYEVIRRIAQSHTCDQYVLYENRLLTRHQQLDILILVGVKLSGWDMVPGALFRDISPEAIAKLNVLP